MKSTTATRFPFLCICLAFLCLTSCSRRATTYLYQSKGETFVFPESDLQLKPTGICFSGGGTRAMTCATGQMKALDSLGIWPHIGYISSVSGGSWASSIFTFYRPTANGPRNDRELLGTPRGAQKLTLQELKQPISTRHMLYAVTRDLTFRLLEGLAEDDVSLGLLERSDDIWIDAVASTYLKPFGLYGGRQSYFTLDRASMQDIIRREPKLRLSERDFHLVHQQAGDAPRPYLVMNSCVLGPSEDLPFPGHEQLTVFNYSPLGVGATQFRNITFDQEKTGEHDFSVGGGFIEPFAMGGTAPLQPPAVCEDERGRQRLCAEIKLHPKRRFRLADAVGTSSAAFAAEVGQNAALGILTEIAALGSIIPEQHYWPAGADNISAESFRFADGGSLEDLGVVSLLQRKVKKLVVFINTDTPIDTTFKPGESAPTEKVIDYDLFTLFADYTYGNHIHNQVFSEADFVRVFNQFVNCVKNGETVMARLNTTTLANPWWGIQAGQEVEILWVYNDKVPDWEGQLPPAIQAEIAKGKSGLFPNFPQYPIAFPEEIPYLQRLSPAMAKLLYELQFWNVYSHGSEFDFLKE
ncbi:hypothetical protein [Flavilitoribacter nigricans]|uniref:Uncharacterized protein n=1 Tax=Flavilitoribacter nigricans (strain ATCC 23147 / DSM 23189 / NBRC 102662 / NCIMB 1420 / SS-2) TaxID=1122177 RepID=A0A2D0NAM3_FLAN2|nr:hypothetical protein [Flavilitoribacter nigricans]PHN05209.1 hypothetical protein CRP01_16960 [Flavilitoribacter nigricans DSM 23189 = NBRC 102662]